MKTKLTKKELAWIWDLVSINFDSEDEEWENMQEKLEVKLSKMIGELK